MDFSRGIAEVVEAAAQRRPSRLSARFSLHLNEIVLALDARKSGGQSVVMTTRCETRRRCPGRRELRGGVVQADPACQTPYAATSYLGRRNRPQRTAAASAGGTRGVANPRSPIEDNDGLGGGHQRTARTRSTAKKSAERALVDTNVFVDATTRSGRERSGDQVAGERPAS